MTEVLTPTATDDLCENKRAVRILLPQGERHIRNAGIDTVLRDAYWLAASRGHLIHRPAIREEHQCSVW